MPRHPRMCVHTSTRPFLLRLASHVQYPNTAKVGTAIINPKGLNAVGGVYPDEVYANFPVMLRKLATIYFIVSAVGAFGIRPPPAAPKTGNNDGKVAKQAPGLRLGQALKDRKFWLLWFMVRERGGQEGERGEAWFRVDICAFGKVVVGAVVTDAAVDAAAGGGR